jgi:4-diphosphocytidyl-2-C-methyl-D-erythritol kinase
MTAEILEAPAPAKLNLFLHVTGRRADGYHELETVFQLVDLQDRVRLRLRTDGAIVRIGGLPGVPADADLVVRAARLLQAASGTRLGVEIGLDKAIPMGGGLGGGSSDAATVLLSLDRLWNLGWPAGRLAELGLSLGADVPFFLFGRNALARGVGERLEPIDLPDSWFVVVAPPVAVPTAAIFGAPDLTRDTEPLKISGLSRDDWIWQARNDLEPVPRSRCGTGVASGGRPRGGTGSRPGPDVRVGSVRVLSRPHRSPCRAVGRGSTAL